jgi:hypothetical protein
MCLKCHPVDTTKDLSRVNKKGVGIFQTPPFEKGRTIPDEKCHFLLDLDCLVNEMDSPSSNSAWRKV